MGSRPVSSILPWSLPQFLPTGSCPAWIAALALLSGLTQLSWINPFLPKLLLVMVFNTEGRKKKGKKFLPSWFISFIPFSSYRTLYSVWMKTIDTLVLCQEKSAIFHLEHNVDWKFVLSPLFQWGKLSFPTLLRTFIMKVCGILKYFFWLPLRWSYDLSLHLWIILLKCSFFTLTVS